MSCTNPEAPLQPLHLTRGASKTFLFTVRDPKNNPVDLTGAKVWFTVKNRLEDVGAIISKKNAAVNGVDGQALVNPTQTSGSVTRGQFSVFCTPPDSSGLDPEASFWCDAWVQLALYTGTSTGVAPGSLSDTAKSFTVNALAGGVLRDSTGAEFIIASNSATQINVTGNPAAGVYAVYLGKRYQVMKNRGLVIDPAVTTVF